MNFIFLVTKNCATSFLCLQITAEINRIKKNWSFLYLKCSFKICQLFRVNTFPARDRQISIFTYSQLTDVLWLICAAKKYLNVKNFNLVPSKLNLVQKNFNLVSKKFNLVPKKFNLVPKIFNLVPKTFNLVPKKSDLVQKKK